MEEHKIGNKTKSETIKIHPLTLTFYDGLDDLESDYQAYHYEKFLILQRIAILIAIFFYAFFGILDAYLVPEKKHIFWFIRYAVACPFSLIVFIFTFSQKYRKHKNIVLFSMFIVAGFGIDMMILLADPPASYSYYTGIILILIYLFTFIRMQFVWAFFASWLMILFYEIIAIGLIDTPNAVLVNNNFFIIVGNIFCILAGYSIERTSRKNYLLSSQLDKEKQVILYKNEELEKRINSQYIAEKALKKRNLEIENIVKDRTKLLKKSEALHRKFIDNAPVGMFSLNLNGEFTYINRKLEEITGYKTKNWLNKSFHPIIHPDDLEKVIKNFKSRIKGITNPEPYQIRVFNHKHEILWVKITSESIVEEREGIKSITGVQTFVEDVTKAKRSQEINQALFAISNAVTSTKNLPDLYKKIHNLLGKIIDVTNFYIAIVNEKERTLYFPYYVDTVDEDFSPLTNFDPQESLTGLVVSHRKPILLKRKKLQKLADKNGVWGPVPLIWMGVPLIVRDEIMGVIVVQSYTNADVYTEHDLEIMSSISDQVAVVIDRKRTEDELGRSEEKFRTAFKISPHVITLTRVDDGVYVDINDTFTKLLGYSPEEIIGKSSVELDIWSDPADRERLVSGLKMDGLVENLQADFIGKDGQIIIGSMSARTLDINDKKYLLAVTQDLTSLKKFEQERLELEIKLQQAQKMEAIGTLAGGIAHDFNNILSGIFGYSELALDEIENPENVKNCITQIDKGSKRAAELVRQILTFSRQDVYQKKSLKISVAIQEALQLLRSSIPTSIEILKRIDSDSVVLADPIKIHQLLINLCTNAYHAIGSNNGSIAISLTDREIQKSEMIKLTQIPPGKYLELEVTDTGSGMDKSVLDKIFDPYFTTKQTGQGTGLGLALVRAIVKEHEGFITVNSVPGQGTSFFVYFPIYQMKSDQILPASSITANLDGNESIMFVDDEKAIRDISEEIIKRHGYDIQVFENGSEALSEFEKDPYRFDLIITDMTMPKMSGDQLAKAIMKINPGMPLLLCTGFSETLSKEKASSIGIKNILNKPLALSDLLITIRKTLDED